MKIATVANAKSHLSALLTNVEAGQEIVITRRGRPVARLIPEPGGLRAGDALHLAVASLRWHYFKYKYEYGDSLSSPDELERRFDAVLSDDQAMIYRTKTGRFLVYSSKEDRLAVVSIDGQRISVHRPDPGFLATLGGLSMANASNDRLITYRVEAECVLPSGEGVLLRENREWIATLALTYSERHDLQELDGYVIEQITQGDVIADYLLKDDSTRPLTAWWWHFGKLRVGTYPAHLLPLHLQEIYQPTEQCLAA